MLFIKILLIFAFQLPLIAFGNNITLTSLLDSAEVYRKIDLAKSHQFLDKGLEILSDQPHDSLRCTFYYSKMLTYHYQAQYDACKVYLKQIKENPCFLSYAEFRYQYYYFGSVLQKRKSNIDSALVLLSLAQEALEGTQNQEQELQLLSSFGSAFYSKKEYRTAITYLLEAEDLFIHNPRLDRIQQCNVLHNLGALFTEISAHDKAKKYLTRSLAISNETPVQRIQNLTSLGSLYLAMDSLELAQNYYELSRKENTYNSYLITYSQYGLGKVHLAKGNYEKSIELFKEAYQGFIAVDDADLSCEAAYALASIYLDKQAEDDALYWLNKHLEHASEYNLPQKINDQEYLSLKYKLLLLDGKASADQLSLYRQRADSINDYKLKAEIYQIEEDQKLRQSIDSIQLLKKSVLHYERQASIKNWVIMGLIASFFLMVWFGYKTRNKLLTNQEIEKPKVIEQEVIPIKKPDVHILNSNITIDGDKKINTKLKDINYILSKDGGIQVILIDGTKSFLWTSLSKYLKQLPQDFFVRISKFQIVNVAQVDKIIDYTISLKNGEKLKFSPAYKEQFFKIYEQLDD